MAGEPQAPDGAALPDVLAALDDPDCRAIVDRLDGPMSARELSAACDIPTSTVYRKLDLLRDASLLAERPDLGPGGPRRTLHVLAFDEVRIGLDADRTVDVVVERNDRPPSGPWTAETPSP